MGTGRRGARARRTTPWAFGATVAAVAAVAVLLAPSAGAFTITVGPPFLGSSWSPFGERLFSGCTSSAMSTPTWSAKTGVGHWAGRTYADSCPASRGGQNQTSEAFVYGGLTVTVPVHMVRGPGGANVTWSMDVGARASSVANLSQSCPVQRYTYSYNYGYTKVNYYYILSDCYALGYLQILSNSMLLDKTSGAYYYPSNYWSGIYNSSGASNYSVSYGVNYTNSSYWSYNYTYNYSANLTYGSPTLIQATFAPTAFINGTFSASDKYEIITDVQAEAGSIVLGYVGASASARVNMATLGHSLTLEPIQLW